MGGEGKSRGLKMGGYGLGWEENKGKKGEKGKEMKDEVGWGGVITSLEWALNVWKTAERSMQA